jgi:hypothetical protein
MRTTLRQRYAGHQAVHLNQKTRFERQWYTATLNALLLLSTY